MLIFKICVHYSQQRGMIRERILKPVLKIRWTNPQTEIHKDAQVLLYIDRLQCYIN